MNEEEIDDLIDNIAIECSDYATEEDLENAEIAKERLCAHINLLKSKCDKLKQLILFTDPVMGNELCGSEVQLKQWMEFIKCFPDEGEV